MTDEAPEKSSKTEDPTHKKLEDAHKRGDVVKSQEVTTWFMIAGSGLLFSLMAAPTGAALTASLREILANADRFEVGGSGFGAFFNGRAGAILLVALVPLGVLLFFGIAGNLVQHMPVLSIDPIKPKLSKISPIQGFKRLFSTEALVNFGKGIIKIGVVSAVLVFVLWPDLDRLETIVTSDPAAILAQFQEMGVKIIFAVLSVVTLMALADYVYQRHRGWERQKMTVQETRDEHKQLEGDPMVKGRIRAIRNERSRKRMMAAVPEATVVITNPTHYAVALKYDKTMPAPQVVAKGVDALALRIRALARDNDVPVVENPPLARALYAGAEVGERIPEDQFKAVAQVIGYVMRLRSRSGWKPGSSTQ